MFHTLKTLLFLLLLSSLSACYADQQGNPMTRNYTDTHTAPPAFDPKRTQFDCARWAEPAPPDEASQRWYQAATTIQAKRFRLSVAEYQKMLILYEGAARKGHYKAVKDLIINYNEGGYAMGTEFAPEPEKARYWLHYGLDKEWAGAFEWLSNALHYGNAGYPADDKLSLAYLQKAANLGVPFAQYDLAMIYGDQLERRDAKLALSKCAAAQAFPPALNILAMDNEIDGNAQIALELHQQALMGGGVKGSVAAAVLAGTFAGEKQYHDDLQTVIDPERTQAYREIEIALDGTDSTSGNLYFRFPRLNEVLPLPPAKMPPWQGIYSAMSKENAHYYQNPPNPDTLIAEIKAAGLLVSEDYITKPAPKRPPEMDDEGNDL